MLANIVLPSQSGPTTNSYRPSPLSFGSPRASPFRRPESPQTSAAASSPSSTIRPTTPSKLSNGFTTASKHTQEDSSPHTSPTRPSSSAFYSPRSSSDNNIGNGFTSPISTTSTLRASGTSTSNYMNNNSNSNALSSTTALDTLTRLPPALVREMREAFQILDRNSDGLVDASDVAEMHASLGLPTSQQIMDPYFSAAGSRGGQQQQPSPNPLPLPAYLGQLGALLAPLSAPSEMLAALGAFDDDDSGQVDVAELMQALCGGGPAGNGAGAGAMARADVEKAMEGFVGKRAFGAQHASSSNSAVVSGMGGRRGDVFRYREWVGALGAVASNSGDGSGSGDARAGAKTAVAAIGGS